MSLDGFSWEKDISQIQIHSKKSISVDKCVNVFFNNNVHCHSDSLTLITNIFPPDPCSKIDCQNGGTCIASVGPNKTCDCTQGFTGSLCETGQLNHMNISYFV